MYLQICKSFHLSQIIPVNVQFQSWKSHQRDNDSSQPGYPLSHITDLLIAWGLFKGDKPCLEEVTYSFHWRLLLNERIWSQREQILFFLRRPLFGRDLSAQGIKFEVTKVLHVCKNACQTMRCSYKIYGRHICTVKAPIRLCGCSV